MTSSKRYSDGKPFRGEHGTVFAVVTPGQECCLCGSKDDLYAANVDTGEFLCWRCSTQLKQR